MRNWRKNRLWPYNRIPPKNKFWYVYKLERWIPNELKEQNFTKDITICSTLFARQSFWAIFRRFSNLLQKWLSYDDPKLNVYLMTIKNLAIAKPINHQQRMLCIWWDDKDLSTLSCCHPVKPLLLTCVLSNYISGFENLKKTICTI